MAVQKDKIETLTGFAVKAGKLVYGSDNIVKGRKKQLVMMCGTAAENTQKAVKSFCKESETDLIITQKPLEEIVYRKNCKVIAFTDKQMAEAIKENINENYTLIIAEV